jgi:hypothetical protein
LRRQSRRVLKYSHFATGQHHPWPLGRNPSGLVATVLALVPLGVGVNGCCDAVVGNGCPMPASTPATYAIPAGDGVHQYYPQGAPSKGCTNGQAGSAQAGASDVQAGASDGRGGQPGASGASAAGG